MFQRFRFAPHALAVVLAANTPALQAAPVSHAASESQAASASHSVPSSPYAGQQTREIKALSAQEIQSLLDGRGMGFAKAAELNGYPGPAHVLELDKELALSVEQRRRTRALFEAMERDAIALGNALVDAEHELDRLFAGGTVTSQSLESALARAGVLQAKLRGIHLQAHIEQARILDAAQVQKYSALRGYGDGHGGPGAHGSHPGGGAAAGGGHRHRQ